MSDKNSEVRTVLFLGRPGSGKETQARLLADRTGYHLFSTGERFRELREHRDSLGEHIKEIYDTGKLMPAWFSCYLFEDALLHTSHGTGIIFEGTGRWREEAELFDEVANWLGRVYRVIHLEVSEEEAMRRQLMRAKAKDRPDSNSEEKVRVRFSEFAEHTQKAIDFFREKGVLIDVDGEKKLEDISAAINAELGIS